MQHELVSSDLDTARAIPSGQFPPPLDPSGLFTRNRREMYVTVAANSYTIYGKTECDCAPMQTLLSSMPSARHRQRIITLITHQMRYLPMIHPPKNAQNSTALQKRRCRLVTFPTYVKSNTAIPNPTSNIHCARPSWRFHPIN